MSIHEFKSTATSLRMADFCPVQNLGAGYAPPDFCGGMPPTMPPWLGPIVPIWPCSSSWTKPWQTWAAGRNEARRLGDCCHTRGDFGKPRPALVIQANQFGVSIQALRYLSPAGLWRRPASRHGATEVRKRLQKASQVMTRQ